MATTNEQLHSEFDEWHINHLENAGDPGTCSDNRLYDNNDSNKKHNGPADGLFSFTEEDGAHNKHMWDSYYVGDNNAYGMTDADLLTNQLNCQSSEMNLPTVEIRNKEIYGDICVNFATTDKAMKDGTPQFRMGSGSGDGDFINIDANGVSGSVGDLTDVGDQCTKADRDSGCSGDWEDSFGDCEMNGCSESTIDKVLGIQPAWFVNKDQMNANQEFESVAFTSSLAGCPLSDPRIQTCVMDGDGVGDTPGCGLGSDEGEDGAVSICRRSQDDYKEDNIVNCCLNIDQDSNAEDFSRCPKDYCKSARIPLTTVNEEGEDVIENKFALSTKCNNFFDLKCSKEVFESDSDRPHKLKEPCVFWAHLRPEEWSVKAQEVCAISEEDKTIMTAENDGTDQQEVAKEGTKRKLRSLFSNPLCLQYIKDNLPIMSPKLLDICKMTVTNDVDITGDVTEKKWVKTKEHEGLESICPCYYPQGYYDYYKQGVIDKSDDPSIKASLKQHVKPECYMPECQRTLLYDTSGGSACPSLQICANTIHQNIQVIGGEQSINEGTGGAHQECNFNNTQVLPENPIPDRSTPPTETNGKKPPGIPKIQEGKAVTDLTLVYGGIVFFVIFMVMIFMMVL